MKTYEIPITYSSLHIVNVEAESLQDAVNIAVKEFLAIPDDKYMDDSITLDDILEDWYPDEDYDLNKAF